MVTKSGITVVLSLLLLSLPALAKDFTIGIMYDHTTPPVKYRLLEQYLSNKGIKNKIRGYSRYYNATIAFQSGKLDALFAGSGAAGILLTQKKAYPLVRPVSSEGWSTYRAVILAFKGKAFYNGNNSFFNNKSISCTELASSGEFFVRSLQNPSISIVKAGSHLQAIKTLMRGVVDYAVVKNRVWDNVQSNFPQLEKIGEDFGSNPNMVLMVSTQASATLAKRIKQVLINLENDSATEAIKLKKALDIDRFIITTTKDFSNTLNLLEKAGITDKFNFKKGL